MDDDEKDDEDSQDSDNASLGAKRRKRDVKKTKSRGSVRSNHSRGSQSGRRKMPPSEISTTSGSKVACEIVYTFSTATVLWQVMNYMY